ncbi:MAG: tRNA pseudouridine(55) synthase TruB, partial [Planctomycetes bacterium]|nr:tRNA pseudouridine(55) synthase TruB [Planctomycetota bacterium]
MDGLINLHKPSGITSAKALYKVRSITKVRKSGHAGTLDPAATGVLVLCLGKATKLVESIMNQPKVYRATARLDVTSESYDSDRPLVPVDVAQVPTDDDVRRACDMFVGEIEQTPPIYSAVHINGQRAYKLARRGEAVDMPTKTVRIDAVDVLEYTWPTLTLRVSCGRGTYIRSLARDIGTRLGTVGHL